MCVIFDPQSTKLVVFSMCFLLLIGTVKIKRQVEAGATEVIFIGAALTIERDAVFYSLK